MSSNDDVYEIINLGNSSPVSLKEMIDEIGKVVHKTPIIKQLPMQPGDVNKTYADISKAQRMLGYNPKTSFHDGLEAFYKWYTQHM